MVVKLKKKIRNLKIGLLGTRKSLLADVLDKRKILFCHIDRIASIDSSFDIIFASGIYSLSNRRWLFEASRIRDKRFS
tara:strand:+ start:17 stop:250 length:234 start_codon:yes stop_codon:yes gene_type:complete